MREERGQILPFMVVGVLIVLLGIAGLVVDVGHGYWAKRQLQASVDAAALAAAQALPDTTAASSLAGAYGPGAGGLNAVQGVDGSPATTITARCLTTTPWCTPSTPNAVQVTSTTSVSTAFGRLFGMSSFTVSAKATACSPCGSKPLDIMFLIDRTGSMCQFHDGTPDPACTDLANARAGMKTFLQQMDPTLDHVGLAVLPPAWDPSERCSDPSKNANGTPRTLVYTYPWPIYTLVPLSSDYLVGGYGTAFNTNSLLYQTIECMRAGGGTAYADALEYAQKELNADGRPGVQKIIVFMSDGAANSGDQNHGMTSPYMTQPCHQGVASAGAIKSTGTLIYSIGYDVNPVDNGFERCVNAASVSGANEAPAITAYQALQQIATNPNDFYLGNQLTASQMQQIFGDIARDILKGSSKLVSDDA